MARKEPFTPIWNYDDPEEKKERKKMTIKELDRERGKRETPPREEEEPKQFVGMFAEDRAAHHMTKKKEKVIIIVAIVVAILVAVLVAILKTKWEREYWRRYMAVPQNAWSVSCMWDASRGEVL